MTSRRPHVVCRPRLTEVPRRRERQRVSFKLFARSERGHKVDGQTSRRKGGGTSTPVQLGFEPARGASSEGSGFVLGIARRRRVGSFLRHNRSRRSHC